MIKETSPIWETFIPAIEPYTEFWTFWHDEPSPIMQTSVSPFPGLTYNKYPTNAISKIINANKSAVVFFFIHFIWN